MAITDNLILSPMENFSKEFISGKYNSLKVIWDQKDKWHYITKHIIERFLLKNKNFLPKDIKILNAGSAGNSYGLAEENITHIDIAESKLKGMQNAVVGDIQKTSFPDNSFGAIICVGSVINYCDPSAVLLEFNRILNKKAVLILEFENSNSFEFLWSAAYGQNAYVVSTFYNNVEEMVWVFSESYILRMLEAYDFKILKKIRFHLLSPLIYRLTGNIHLAAKFSKFDFIMRKIPILNKVSSNVILLAIRNQSV